MEALLSERLPELARHEFRAQKYCSLAKLALRRSCFTPLPGTLLIRDVGSISTSWFQTMVRAYFRNTVQLTIQSLVILSNLDNKKQYNQRDPTHQAPCRYSFELECP
jgi:hypothetical protein